MPVTNFSHPDPYTYQNGFDSYHEYVVGLYRIVSDLTDFAGRKPSLELSP